MTVLPKRRVGKTKLEVTTLGLGGAPMGGFRATISDAEAVALSDAAYDGGVRYFDTSPFYGYGRSELRMGAALRDKPREEFVLSTKIGRILHAMKPGEKKPADFRENGLPGFAPVFDYTYDGVMRSLEHSHLRLGLAKIDIALIHDVDFWTIKDRKILDERFKTVMDGGFKALDELRKAGVIGAIGVGINESDTSLRFIKAGDFDCMLLAGRYTLLEQGGLEEFLPECVKRNVSVILGGPYNSGILTGGVKPGATHDYVGGARAPDREGAEDRGGVPAPRRRAGRRRHAVPAVPSGALLGDPGRAQHRRGEAEHRAAVGQDPGRAVERAQAREAARRQRADAELASRARACPHRCAFGQLRSFAIGIRTSRSASIGPSGCKQPDGAARSACRASCGSDQTMHRAATRRRNATRPANVINSSARRCQALRSSSPNFSFRDFWRSIRGHV